MEAQLPEEKSKALAAIVEENGASENCRFMLALVAAGTGEGIVWGACCSVSWRTMALDG